MSNAFLVSLLSEYHRLQSFQNSDHVSHHTTSWVNHISSGAKTCLPLTLRLKLLPIAALLNYLLTTWVLKSMFYKTWELYSLLIKWTTCSNSLYFVWFSPNCVTISSMHSLALPGMHFPDCSVCLGTKSDPTNGK